MMKALGIVLLLLPSLLLFSRIEGKIQESLQFVVEMQKHYPFKEDEEALERINNIGYQLVSQLDEVAYPFSFQIVKMPEPNAFALPGGFIFITSGMLKLPLDDDALASLLGHEITHVIHRHAERMQKKATLMGVLQQLALIGVLMSEGKRERGERLPWIYAPDSQIPQTTSQTQEHFEAVYAFGAVMQALLLEGYSRQYELEADREGLRLAVKAGFDPQGGIELLKTLSQRIYEAPGFGYWRSHPYFDQRLTAFSSMVPSMKAQNPSKDTRAVRQRIQDQFFLFTREVTKPQEVQVLQRFGFWANPGSEMAFQYQWKNYQEDKRKIFQLSPLSRDLGHLLARLEKLIQKYPGKKHLLHREKEALLTINRECVPIYREILREGVPDLPFLKRTLSNYPKSPLAEEASLRLFFGYVHQKRWAEAFDLLIHSPMEDKTRESLLGIYFDHLTSLNQTWELMEKLKASPLQIVLKEKLYHLASSLASLKEGRTFLEEHPDWEGRDRLIKRMETLAEKKYKKGVFYESLGENQKALDLFNEVLIYAPQTEAAEKIRQRILQKEGLS